ncbi:zf-HC2 domain-containing protein [Streptomyces sp. NPDC048182]|uniref:zf-HC2 domain-containing protein n=1 Tax=Streptomyces sp. NPDC048182 TaxID=3365507 RepID=UPI0037222D0D
MRSLERHRDVGAYTLGVLDEADAFRFEDHLSQCPLCALRLSELGSATRQLTLYRRATPGPVHPFAVPGPRLLDHLLAVLAAHRRAGRRRLLYGVAAAALVGAGTLSGAALLTGGGDPAVRLDATDERSGVRARVTAAGEPWGSAVELEVRDGAGPRVCRLVAVGRDGTEQTVTSWRVAGHDARSTTVHGGAALRPDQIARYEVRTAAGERLVTLRAR